MTFHFYKRPCCQEWTAAAIETCIAVQTNTQHDPPHCASLVVRIHIHLDGGVVCPGFCVGVTALNKNKDEEGGQGRERNSMKSRWKVSLMSVYMNDVIMAVSLSLSWYYFLPVCSHGDRFEHMGFVIHVFRKDQKKGVEIRCFYDSTEAKSLLLWKNMPELTSV